MNAIDIVNNYFDILENKKGEGLADVITEDVTFDGIFVKASGRQDFVNKFQSWVQLKKKYHTIKQFVDGNQVCSIQEIDITTPTGAKTKMELADWIELRDGKIANERVYFDPREFGKAMGLKAGQ